MEHQDLYELVEKRVDQRNRRRLLWAMDLAGLVMALALLAGIGERGYASLAAGLFLAWGGVFTLHTIWLWMAETRTHDIDKEVAKLRQAMYEKPKRLELSDEGELVDLTDTAVEDQQRHKHLMGS